MANTLRVDVCYRPLRIGWAVRQGDMGAIRQAVRYSHALWGGRFNPILVVDHVEEASQVVELFRLDLIWPLGSSQEVKDFCAKFSHLISPFHSDSIFVKQAQWKNFSWVLDIANALSHWHMKPEWKFFKDEGLRSYEWEAGEPLADVFLMQFGGYPSAEEVGVDYAAMVSRVAEPITVALTPQTSLPMDVMEHPTLASLGRFGIDRHHTVRPGWDAPGFFIGDANEPDDLVAYWNIRACDIPLWFIDRAQQHRYADVIPPLEQAMRGMVEHRHESNRHLGLWSRQQIDTAGTPFADMQLMHCQIQDHFWSGGAVRAPMMYFGQVSTLGVMGDSNGVPLVNFALADKPFDGDPYYRQQHLVASISFIGGLYGDEQNTFDVPYVPELNEFYARTMHFEYDKFRIEPERVGLVIGASDNDSFLTAMPVADLLKRIFLMAGLESKLSNSGRIVRQLLTQLDGLQGARVFKIPGVRQLLKKFRLRDTFSRNTARDLIIDKTPEQPNGTFSPHADLFLGPRPLHSKLTPYGAFDFMVGKGLFRIGMDLDCPKCGMSSWISLDMLKQEIACELCGNEYDATHQLLGSNGWHFRRSGVLGAERNAQGAVPVALTLQQLAANLDHLLNRGMYSPSLDVKSNAGAEPLCCEVDFVWLEKGHRAEAERTAVIFAECKDQGPIKPDEFQRDVENLRRVAGAFPKDRFEVFLLFVKLAPFTTGEIAMARALNGPFHRRVILLTARELETHRLFEWLKVEQGREVYCSSPQDLANVTAQLYFTDPPVNEDQPGAAP
ncbi:hypothetical protein [Dyella sp. S184]|uniref:hypothetical protein n=1 Tax=Dyella sp. S184 TaxID=1641862 RepID=UPI00131CA80E|nr:hypothetical protein [Dyella sp. S184]